MTSSLPMYCEFLAYRHTPLGSIPADIVLVSSMNIPDRDDVYRVVLITQDEFSAILNLIQYDFKIIDVIDIKPLDF